MKQEWFESWFDSEYYHLLYNNRDFNEAEKFINNLLNYIRPKGGAHVLDLGCGKGRHSLYLNNQNLTVTGVDLSSNSIDSLLQFNSKTLRFEQWDMRNPYKKSEFDFVFNLFTSFGYFDSNVENLKVLNAVNFNLKDEGMVVLDYLNESLVRSEIVEEACVKRGDIDFVITRKIEDQSIVKTISFQAENNNFSYEERVQLITKKEFEILFEQSGFSIEKIFGDYDLNDFEEEKSPRIIFLAKKIL